MAGCRMLKRMVPQWEQRNLRLAVSELGYHMGVLGAAAVAKRFAVVMK
jgi:hypothetical protein